MNKVKCNFRYCDCSLLVATSDGDLHILSETGLQLLRQRIHPNPIVSIRVRPAGVGLDPDLGEDDITLVCRDAIVRVIASEVRLVLRRPSQKGGNAARMQTPDGYERSRAREKGQSSHGRLQ
jgi:hypothetical protein